MAAVLIVVIIMVGAVIVGLGERGAGFGLKASVPFAAGAMSALLVLLVFEARSRSEESRGSGSSSCTSCGQPLIEGSRLCPHCGRLLEPGLSLPMEGDRTDG